MESGAFRKAFMIMATATTLVVVYPLLHNSSPLLKENLKSYSVFPNFIQFQSFPDSTQSPLRSLATLPDSVLEDSIKSAGLIETDLADISLDPTVSPLEGTYQGIEYLYPYFKKLHAREGQIRIAYYGDSSIEGDLICMTFRDSLQRRYGGKGVGFIPLTSIHPGFRRSIHQAASNNWSRSVVGSKNYKNLRPGISGEYFTARYAPPMPDTLSGDSMPPPIDATYWATFKASKWFSRTQQFDQARLFFGRPQLDSTQVQMGSLSVSANQKRSNYTLKPRGLVNDLTILDTVSQRLRLDFRVPNNFPLYGVSIESERGIIVDNFPLRGSDGGSLQSVSKSILSAFQEKLDYDLIIFQFGLNVMNSNLKDYSWYQAKIEKLIRHYQEAMPGVPILVVGISDKGTKINGRMQTEPSVPRITEAQRAAAQNTQVAFFSLYEAMGGSGTMVNWVEKERPKLANLDYTHFNFKGARKISYFLIEHLNGNYMDYVVHHAPEL
jgi:lysophospholipase L1-like esterase